MYNIIITLLLLLIHTHARAHPRGRGRRRSALYFLLQTNSRRSTSLFLSFERVVVQKFLDQIHVTHEHASTAVSLQLQRVQRVLLGVIRLQQIEVRVPLVSNHLMRERDRVRPLEKRPRHWEDETATTRFCERRRSIRPLLCLLLHHTRRIIIAKKRRQFCESIDRYKSHIAIFAALSLSTRACSIESPPPGTNERTKKT